MFLFFSPFIPFLFALALLSARFFVLFHYAAYSHFDLLFAWSLFNYISHEGGRMRGVSEASQLDTCVINDIYLALASSSAEID